MKQFNCLYKFLWIVHFLNKPLISAMPSLETPGGRHNTGADIWCGWTWRPNWLVPCGHREQMGDQSDIELSLAWLKSDSTDMTFWPIFMKRELIWRVLMSTCWMVDCGSSQTSLSWHLLAVIQSMAVPEITVPEITYNLMVSGWQMHMQAIKEQNVMDLHGY